MNKDTLTWHSGPARAGGDASLVWHSGPPPHVGWWNASRDRDTAVWRWWNGTTWSFSVVCADNVRIIDRAQWQVENGDNIHVDTGDDCYAGG